MCVCFFFFWGGGGGGAGCGLRFRAGYRLGLRVRGLIRLMI